MIRQILYILWVMFVFTCVYSIALAETDKSAMERFFEANQAYKTGRFQEAADGYIRLVEEGHENGHLFYNLGNACFQIGELGKAILYYEKASLLIPRDADLNFNLSHARSLTQDAVSPPASSLFSKLLGLDSFNFHEIFLVFAVLNVMLFSVLCFRLFKKTEWAYYLAILLVIFNCVGGLSLGLKWYGISNDNRAVVLAKEADVRAGPDPGDTILFKVHEGTIVHYDRAEDDWILLQLSEDKRGWVRDNQIERIVR